MQVQVNAEETRQPIQILGVDAVGRSTANEGVRSGRTLPWLLPTTDEDVWSLWDVVYRDVIILGPGNEHLGTFNLTEHSLANADDFLALKNQLLEAANE